jgi:hypothetical protein
MDIGREKWLFMTATNFKNPTTILKYPTGMMNAA